MVSTRPLISKFSSPCTNPLVTEPITIGITVTFIFHIFFYSLAKVQALIPFFVVFQFYSVLIQDTQVHNSASSVFSFVDYYKVLSSSRD